MVFLDHMMPEMDGIETFRHIREEKLCEGVPIIMLTANAIVGDREKYLEEGFTDFLSKPIMPDKLDKMILHYLPKGFANNCEEEQVNDNENEGMLPENIVSEKHRLPQEQVLEELRNRLPQINFEKGLAICSEDVTFYLELFGDFSKLPIKEELEGFLSKGDYNNYRIRIHGFKNNAYSIGAMELGDLAYEMEKNTKGEVYSELPNQQKKLFELYDDICVTYREII